MAEDMKNETTDNSEQSEVIKDQSKMKKKSYSAMITAAILASNSKRSSREQIGVYIQNNFEKVSTGSRFLKALKNNIEKGIKSGALVLNKDCNEYKIGSKAVTKTITNTKLKQQLPFRKYPYAKSRTECCDDDTHIWTHTHFKEGMKVMKTEISDIKKNIYPSTKDSETPALLRKRVYRVLAVYMVTQGYWWYGPGHALPGIFRELANKEIPDTN
eukprot:118236_1